jgi:hypothetical protein
MPFIDQSIGLNGGEVAHGASMMSLSDQRSPRSSGMPYLTR